MVLSFGRLGTSALPWGSPPSIGIVPRQAGSVTSIRTAVDRRGLDRGEPDKRKTPAQVEAAPERPNGERRTDGGPAMAFWVAVKEFYATPQGKIVLAAGVAGVVYWFARS